ncbi:MAG: hypothetical protein ACI3VZ_01670 [Faecousia sp.]
MIETESTLFMDPQREWRTRECPNCGTVTYFPGFFCCRCREVVP